MMLGCKSYSGLYIRYTVRTVWVASKVTGQKENNEYCSPEIGPLQKLLKDICEASTCLPIGEDQSLEGSNG